MTKFMREIKHAKAVTLRNGETHSIENLQIKEGDRYPVVVTLGDRGTQSFTKEGIFYISPHECSYDIVKVINKSDTIQAFIDQEFIIRLDDNELRVLECLEEHSGIHWIEGEAPTEFISRNVYLGIRENGGMVARRYNESSNTMSALRFLMDVTSDLTVADVKSELEAVRKLKRGDLVRVVDNVANLRSIKVGDIYMVEQVVGDSIWLTNGAYMWKEEIEYFGEFEKQEGQIYQVIDSIDNYGEDPFIIGSLVKLVDVADVDNVSLYEDDYTQDWLYDVDYEDGDVEVKFISQPGEVEEVEEVEKSEFKFVEGDIVELDKIDELNGRFFEGGLYVVHEVDPQCPNGLTLKLRPAPHTGVGPASRWFNDKEVKPTTGLTVENVTMIMTYVNNAMSKERNK